MVSVTRENIANLFSEIEANITKSAFVCIDTEFSGLTLGGSDVRESRFDTASDRYARYRKNIIDASLLQLGIACFMNGPHGPIDDGGGDADHDHLDDDEPSYRVVCYNILLAPADLGLVAFRPRVLMAEWPAMRFLSSHGFDLNQVVKNGVSCLRIADVQRLAKFLSPGLCSLKETEFDSDAIRTADRELQEIRDIVEKSDQTHDQWDFDSLKSAPLALHWMVREEFPYMWTRPNAWNSLQAEYVHGERIKLEKSDRTLETWTVKEAAYAGRIFTTLVEQRKVIVGYQIIQDILFLIDAFYSPLPEDYKDVKLLLQDLFPNLYDAKVITQALSRNEAINFVYHFDAPGLQETFKNLTSEEQAGMFKYAPQLQHDIRHTFYGWEDHSHEAAYDAFMTGTVFIDCIFAINADITATEKLKLVQKPVENPEKRAPFQKDGSQTCHALPPAVLRQLPSDVKAVTPYRGILMLHMAADKHINTLGDDSQAERSKSCVLLSTAPNTPILASNEALMAYLESCVHEVRRLSDREVMVACAGLDRARGFADHCRRTFKVDAVIVNSQDHRHKSSQKTGKPDAKLPVVICGAVFTAVLGYVCQKIALNR
ncbi:hypothetical protein RvY_00804 [Ramazzottius varieornatus]|uniref:Uncharacterized protein n=1 Tax=Ramazzottius varieornatus TaxID=947166 RepID=A0A1D1UNU8_RAMVA|nr:hypothetical protein RvY_00804 [Ramazzottius varieornatus]